LELQINGNGVQLDGWVMLREVWNFLSAGNWVLGKNLDAPTGSQ